jgi:hypothetical protein
VLVVLDYSGTLSPGAAGFAHPRSLTAALSASGLARLGVHDAATLWSEVIEPTWKAGSTGAASYAECVALGVFRLSPQVDPEHARQAADRFTLAYLEAGSIDDAWQPLLSELADESRARTVIATDHYLEATPRLLGELTRLGVPGLRITECAASTARKAIAVASSADLGALKSEPGFWSQVVERLGLDQGGPRQIVLIDDLGANELADDAYSARDQVLPRRRRIEALLEAILEAPVMTLPCTLPLEESTNADAFRPALESFVAHAAQQVRDLLRGCQTGQVSRP